MRTLGVLGGMSWESTALVYRALNQGVAARRGGLHSAPLVLHSVDFAPMAAMQAAQDWAGCARTLADAARGLRAAGAQALMLATNTMHKVAGAIEDGSGLPLLHIADATGRALVAAGHTRVGLLGTRFTMDDPSIVIDRLQARHGLHVLCPPEAARPELHRVIYDELCRGRVLDGSRRVFQQAIDALRDAGAQAVILGCTEITMLIDAASSSLPVFDTTALHAAAAVDWMLDDPQDTQAPEGDPR